MTDANALPENQFLETPNCKSSIIFSDNENFPSRRGEILARCLPNQEINLASKDISPIDSGPLSCKEPSFILNASFGE